MPHANRLTCKPLKVEHTRHVKFHFPNSLCSDCGKYLPTHLHMNRDLNARTNKQNVFDSTTYEEKTQLFKWFISKLSLLLLKNASKNTVFSGRLKARKRETGSWYLQSFKEENHLRSE